MGKGKGQRKGERRPVRKEEKKYPTEGSPLPESE